MYSITVVLDADDTPKSIVALAALATCRSSAGVGAINATTQPVLFKKLTSNVAFFAIQGEKANNVDATTGSARIGFDNHVDRTVATQHGEELIPSVRYNYPAGGGGSQMYDFNNTFITGKTNDEFQIFFGKV